MIRFSKYIWLYLLISGLVVGTGLFSLIRNGLKPAIDFVGGTLFEVKFNKTTTQSEVEKLAKQNNLVLSSIQQTNANTYILRTKEEQSQNFSKLLTNLTTNATPTAQLVRQESVGPVIGSETLSKAFTASLLAVIGILFYVAYAFKNFRYGIAGIIALVHDIFVLVGCFSLFGYFFGVEVDTLFVTAALTTMSFSMHDTIVVFDRIREYQKKGLKMTYEEICDRALTETMGRSLTNSLTIILMLIALVLLGGSTIRWFSVALLIGMISGTYSSDFIATPILILWRRLDQRRKKKI
jgi:preprotein translocase subunit SecF